MEKCELRLSLPALASDILVRPGHVVTLSIYRVNATEQLLETELSYSKRPARVLKIADVALEHGKGVGWHRTFSCSMEQLLTFEVGCSENEDDSSGCSLEWWQGGKNMNPGTVFFANLNDAPSHVDHVLTQLST
jgi:hypothetical protein